LKSVSSSGRIVAYDLEKEDLRTFLIGRFCDGIVRFKVLKKRGEYLEVESFLKSMHVSVTTNEFLSWVRNAEKISGLKIIQ
jgi:hypothetical protein